VVVCGDPTMRWYGNEYLNHPDHRAVASAALDAVFPSSETRVIFPELLAEGLEPHKVKEVFISGAIPPDTYIDIGDTLALTCEARTAQLDHVARLQVSRRLRAVAHTRRRARRDDVAGAQGHEAAHVGDQRRDREDHLRGVPVLPALAVDRRPERQGLRVAGLIGRDEPRARGAERVGALALGRRPAVLHLELALGDVVHQAVAGD